MPEMGKVDPSAIADIEWIKLLITGIRNKRGELNISPATKLMVRITDHTPADTDKLTRNKTLIIKLAGLSDITLTHTGADLPMSATFLAGHLTGHIQLPAETIEREKVLLKKDIEAKQNEFNRLQSKLANADFVAKAPPQLVAKEQEKLAQLEQDTQRLSSRLTELERLIKN